MSKSKTLNTGLIFCAALCLAAISWFALQVESNASREKDKRKAVETADAPKAIGAYSQAIVSEDFVFVSGQIGLDPKTGALVEGVEAQTEQALKNLEAVLRAAKSDLGSVVKATVYLADMNDFAKVNEIYGRYLKAPYPARATVQAARLPRDARVEIELTALVKD